MKIYIGSDHAGFELKEKLILFLKELGHDVVNRGAFSYEPQDDYPDFVRPVAAAVASDREAKGIVLGGSGQGEAMAANRVPGVRTALWYGGNLDLVKLSREHNNANVLSLGARLIDEEQAKNAVRLWLETPFLEEERHVRRIEKLDR
jgi:ribose 5-phosphate isomerase B